MKEFNDNPFNILIMMVVLIIIGAGMLLISTLFTVLEFNKECELKDISKLVSFNGIRDSDTGLLSRGSTTRNLLMFENGMVKDIRYIDFDIIIGHTYKIYECEAFMVNDFLEVRE